MPERAHTFAELAKMEKVRNFLLDDTRILYKQSKMGTAVERLKNMSHPHHQSGGKMLSGVEPTEVGSGVLKRWP